MLKKYIALFLGIFSFTSAALADTKGLNIFAYPRPAPQTAIYRPTGQKVELGDFSGEFVLVNFWSRHCVPCIKELRKLNKFIKETDGTGIRTIIVSKAEEWRNMEEQRRFLEKFKAPDLDFYVDKKGALTEAFGIFASPHTVLINKQGEEIGRIRGAVDWDDDDVIEYIYKIKAKHGEGTKKQND